jgi:hypothetical protein
MGKDSSSFTFDLETEISAEATVGGVKVGVSADFSYGYETKSSVSEGTYIEGTVPVIPMDSYNNSPEFT